MKEIYKPVIEFEDRYMISNFGNVKSMTTILYPNGIDHPQTYQQTILKPEITYKGYKRVTLAKSGVYKKIYIHRLVCAAFLENKENKPFVNHKNLIKGDNRLENLEWCTRAENTAHYLANK